MTSPKTEPCRHCSGRGYRMTNSVLAVEVIQAMKELNLTGKAMALDLGIGMASVDRIRAGKGVSKKMREKIMEYLGIDEVGVMSPWPTPPAPKEPSE